MLSLLLSLLSNPAKSALAGLSGLFGAWILGAGGTGEPDRGVPGEWYEALPRRKPGPKGSSSSAGSYGPTMSRSSELSLDSRPQRGGVSMSYEAGGAGRAEGEQRDSKGGGLVRGVGNDEKMIGEQQRLLCH